jgi:hypothetical protein
VFRKLRVKHYSSAANANCHHRHAEKFLLEVVVLRFGSGYTRFMQIVNSHAASSFWQVLATASSPSVSNAAVQHGPIALPKNMCGAYRHFSHIFYVRAIGQLTRS